jgi:hypothetical protein
MPRQLTHLYPPTLGTLLWHCGNPFRSYVWRASRGDGLLLPTGCTWKDLPCRISMAHVCPRRMGQSAHLGWVNAPMDVPNPLGTGVAAHTQPPPDVHTRVVFGAQAASDAMVIRPAQAATAAYARAACA